MTYGWEFQTSSDLWSDLCNYPYRNRVVLEERKLYWKMRIKFLLLTKFES
jgi:hypothetical protein